MNLGRWAERNLVEHSRYISSLAGLRPTADLAAGTPHRVDPKLAPEVVGRHERERVELQVCAERLLQDAHAREDLRSAFDSWWRGAVVSSVLV